ncbi:MAG: hypothetical protein AABX54_00865 [Nanoarchaeota archaeon]
MENQDYQTPRVHEYEKALQTSENHSEFYKRFMTWEQLRADRYNAC